MNSRIPGSGKSHFDASWTLGRYVMDHIFRAGISGDLPGMPDYLEYGRRPGGVYVPRFRNGGGEQGVGFKRVYGSPDRKSVVKGSSEEVGLVLGGGGGQK